MKKTEEEIVTMLQEFICAQSGDYADPRCEYDEGYVQLGRYLTGREIGNEGKYSESQIKNYVDSTYKFDVVEAHKNYILDSIETDKKIENQFSLWLDKGIIDYAGCAGIRRDISFEVKTLVNEANIEYFEDLKNRGEVSFEKYMVLGRIQIERIKDIVSTHYKNRFKAIEEAHKNNGASKVYEIYKVRYGKSLPPKEEGYRDPYLELIEDQSAEMYKKYGDFLNGKPQEDLKRLDEKVEYWCTRCKMMAKLHELSCSTQVVFPSDKDYKKGLKLNQKNVNKTSKELSTIMHKYEKNIAVIEKRIKKEEKKELKAAAKNEKIKLLESGKDIEKELPNDYAASLKVDGSGYLSHDRLVVNAVFQKLGISDNKYTKSPVVENAIAAFFDNNNLIIEDIEEKMQSGELVMKKVGNGLSLSSIDKQNTLDIIFGGDSFIIETVSEDKGTNVIDGNNNRVIKSRKTMTYDVNTSIEMARKIYMYDAVSNSSLSDMSFVRDGKDFTLVKNENSNEIIDLLDCMGDIATLDDVEINSFMQTRNKYSSIRLRRERFEQLKKQLDELSEDESYEPLSREELFNKDKEDNRRKILKDKIEKSKFKDELLKCPQFAEMLSGEKDSVVLE